MSAPESVSTWSELESAAANGFNIELQADLSFSDDVGVSFGQDISIEPSPTTTTGTMLSGGGESRLFRVYGTLSLRDLTLTYGFMTTSACNSPYESCFGGTLLHTKSCQYHYEYRHVQA